MIKKTKKIEKNFYSKKRNSTEIDKNELVRWQYETPENFPNQHPVEFNFDPRQTCSE
ncbi:MAG: hypothetical protein AABZ74_14175 [Cyanobacteriota bacterium]